MAKTKNPFWVRSILLMAHPVGSYYWSSDSTSPAVLFGGTWERIKDKFVLAAGDTYAAGATGGEASVMLVKENIPRMSANGFGAAVNTKGSYGHIAQWGWIYSASQVSAEEGFNTYAAYQAVVGTPASEQQRVNNMPPYIAAYCWRRTA